MQNILEHTSAESCLALGIALLAHQLLHIHELPLLLRDRRLEGFNLLARHLLKVQGSLKLSLGLLELELVFLSTVIDTVDLV